MKIKRCIASVIAAAFCSTLIAGSAAAHPKDIWQGKYIGRNDARIVLRLDSSAITSFLTYDDVYKYGTDWNGISSNVNVTVINYAPGMPTVAGQMFVMGKKLEAGALGLTVPYDSSYNIMYDSSGKEYEYHSDWSYVRIYMTTLDSSYSQVRYKTNTAKMTFIHEVGHALKLAHPIVDDDLHDTGYGRPYAVMNQGCVDPSFFPYVTGTVDEHDKECLRYKWGG